MANILNIETSTDVCSVALSSEGMVLVHHEEYENQSHAKVLSVFIDDVLKYATSREIKLDAIAVSQGPGSYTGLRIGLSEAKGLCFGFNIPLIGINTLQLLTVSVLFSHFYEEEVLFVPMIDARRKEVYTAVYNNALEAVVKPHAKILDENSFMDLLQEKKLIFFGNGATKAKDIIVHDNAVFIDKVKPVALDMVALSEKCYRRGEFIDVAYSTPIYLKEFYTTKSNKNILEQNK